MGVTLVTHLIFIFAGSLLYNSFIGWLVNNRILKFDRESKKENDTGNFTKEFDSKRNSFLSEKITKDNEYLINLDTAIIARYVSIFMYVPFSDSFALAYFSLIDIHR
jgi:hypothetical protein